VYGSASFGFSNVDTHKWLAELEWTRPGKYLKCYLHDIEAKTTIDELQYFCRDYLTEFSSHYSLSARGFPNTCKRIHFFRVTEDLGEVNELLFRLALGGDKTALAAMRKAYVGYVVIKPLSPPSFGRTVLAMYPELPPEKDPRPRRIVTPGRNYDVHIAGIELTVEGLAWQSASAVGLCATIALWTLCHAAPFDDYHVPTATMLTQAAHRGVRVGSRMFPSTGLRLEQTLEAIKEQGFSPHVVRGEVGQDIDGDRYFTREKLCTHIAILLRLPATR